MTTLCLFQTEADAELDRDVTTELSDSQPQQRFCCAVCGAYVSDERFKIAVNGQHIHTRTNPQNQTFSFGCFSVVQGGRASGSATDEHSWFNGYRWRFAHCKNCSAQLGWQFTGEQVFYALVLEQLVNCDSD